MASLISPPTAFSSPPFHSDYCLHNTSCFRSLLLKKPHSLYCSSSSVYSSPYSFSRPPESTICYCRRDSVDSPNSDDGHWSLPFQQFLMSAAQKLENFLNSRLNPSKSDMEVRESKALMELEDKKVDVDNWDWERWQRHFSEVEDQERLISLLRSQLNHAVEKEDYEDASRLKVAIAATATKDVVGSVMSTLKKAIEEERYRDAIFVRDNAGAGLVGWWAGVSEDRNDPYGCIIHISAEHGRYVARCYSPRQLATSTSGVPLFEIFITLNEKGEYRHQAVYLKQKEVSEAGPSMFPKSATASSSMNTINPAAGKTDLFAPAIEEDALDDEDKDDSDFANEFSGFQNLLQDMIPGVRVKVLKVTTPDKVDQDLISGVVEQIIEEEGDEKDIEAELDDTDGEDTEDAIPSESEEEKDDEDLDAGIGEIDMEEQSELAVKVVVSGRLVQKLSGVSSADDLVRVPAKLEPKGRKSFTFCIKEDLQDLVSKDQVLPKKKAKIQGQRSVEHVMSDLVKSFSRGEKIPVKVLKDLISLTVRQAQNRQPLSRSTSFSRIDLPVYPDPLNGLYIGSRGPYTSEVIQLKRKFGQWQEDSGTEGPSDLHFYEYVEAVKLTGDPDVPAGKVAFRAKIGKRYQLPHKGIIPEEFGVVARYKGQGRLADPGFRNPRWVDGELVILNGKYIKGGPVVGFVYWAPEYQFLVFFNRLRIQE